jgi:hypothetical protein
MSPHPISRIALGAALLLLLVALPSAASADTRLATNAVTDPTGGATVTAELWQRSSDGAVYPKVTVQDVRADGACAHGSVNWKHENGNTYFDTDMPACGTGASRTYTKGARNWTVYDSASISASVDRGPVASAPLHAFTSGESVVPVMDDRGDGGGGDEPGAKCVRGPYIKRWLSNEGARLRTQEHSYTRLTWQARMCREPDGWVLETQPTLSSMGAGKLIGIGIDLDAVEIKGRTAHFHGGVKQCIAGSIGYVGISLEGTGCFSVGSVDISATATSRGITYSLKGHADRWDWFGKNPKLVWTTRVV